MRLFLLLCLATSAFAQQIVSQVSQQQQYIPGQYPYNPYPGQQGLINPYQFPYQYQYPYGYPFNQYPQGFPQVPSPFYPGVPQVPIMPGPQVIKEVEEVVDIVKPGINGAVPLSPLEAALYDLDHKKQGHSEKYFYGRGLQHASPDAKLTATAYDAPRQGGPDAETPRSNPIAPDTENGHHGPEAPRSEAPGGYDASEFCRDKTVLRSNPGPGYHRRNAPRNQEPSKYQPKINPHEFAEPTGKRDRARFQNPISGYRPTTMVEYPSVMDYTSVIQYPGFNYQTYPGYSGASGVAGVVDGLNDHYGHGAGVPLNPYLGIRQPSHGIGTVPILEPEDLDHNYGFNSNKPFTVNKKPHYDVYLYD